LRRWRLIVDYFLWTLPTGKMGKWENGKMGNIFQKRRGRKEKRKTRVSKLKAESLKVVRRRRRKKSQRDEEEDIILHHKRQLHYSIAHIQYCTTSTYFVVSIILTNSSIQY
jgi:hypothetical protein